MRKPVSISALVAKRNYELDRNRVIVRSKSVNLARRSAPKNQSKL